MFRIIMFNNRGRMMVDVARRKELERKEEERKACG